MSSTNRGRPRNANDDYQTPRWCVDLLLRHVRVSGRFLEPCQGSGNIVTSVIPFVDTVESCEITDDADFLTFRPRHQYDWIVTNPPYSLACEFIERSLSMAANLAMLLRLNFLESERRRSWWQDRIPHALYVLARRPTFEDRQGRPVRGKNGKPGTDSCAYGWFVWSSRREYSGIHVIGDERDKRLKPEEEDDVRES